MNTLDKALQSATAQIPECVATGYVDLTTGMLLSVNTIDSHPQEVIDIIAAATADLFQGPNVVSIEKLFKKSRGIQDDGHHYFKEMIVISDNLIHVFIRSKKYHEQVFTAVCRISANLGMVVTKSRQAVTVAEQSV